MKTNKKLTTTTVYKNVVKLFMVVVLLFIYIQIFTFCVGSTNKSNTRVSNCRTQFKTYF